MKLIFFTVFLSGASLAQYIPAEDQKYFKNDVMEGNNQRERTDLNVKEINKLHAEIATLKSDMAILKADVEELKKKK